MHPTTIFKTFKRWIRSGLHERIFENSVINLHNHGLLDLSTTHGVKGKVKVHQMAEQKCTTFSSNNMSPFVNNFGDT